MNTNPHPLDSEEASLSTRPADPKLEGENSSPYGPSGPQSMQVKPEAPYYGSPARVNAYSGTYGSEVASNSSYVSSSYGGLGSEVLIYGRAPAIQPPSYLLWSIISTIGLGLLAGLGLPFGIVSIVFSVLSNSAWDAGDSELALKRSKLAKRWIYANLITVGSLAFLYVLVLAIMFAGIILLYGSMSM